MFRVNSMILYMNGWWNDELESYSYLRLWGMKSCLFFNHKNNSRAEIHRRYCYTFREENIMKLRNVQWWQLMLQEGRTNIHNNECKGWPSTTLDKTEWYVYAFLEDNCYLTITDMWWDGSKLFTQSEWNNNSSCISIAWNGRSLHMGLSTTHRTLRKSRGSDI